MLEFDHRNVDDLVLTLVQTCWQHDDTLNTADGYTVGVEQQDTGKNDISALYFAI